MPPAEEGKGYMSDPFLQRLDELAQATVPAPAGTRPQLSNQPTQISPDSPAPAVPAAPAAPDLPPPPTGAEQIDTILSDVAHRRNPVQELDRLAALYDPDRNSAFVRGTQRGINQAQQIPGNLGAIYHQLTGDEQAAIASAQAAQDIEQQAPTALVPDIRDIHGWRDFTTYLAEKLGEQTINIGSSIVGGGLGSLVTRMAAKNFLGATSIQALNRARTLGMGGGAAVPNVAFETSGTTSELFEATGQVHAGVSLAAGGVKGVLETLTPFALARTAGFIPGVSAIRLSSIPGAAIRHALLEAGTEMSQEAVDMAARNYVDPNYNPFDSEGVWRLLNAGAAGGLVGGTVGGATRALSGRYPSGFSQNVPPGTVRAMQEGAGTAQENGAPSAGSTTGESAPLSPVDQAIASVNESLALQQAEASRSPIPAMYRDVLGKKKSLATQSHLLSDGGMDGSDPVTAGERAQQSRDYRASVMDDAEAVLGERALPRYRVLKKGTYETVEGMPSEALTPRAVEDAMAKAGSQNIQLERVDYSKLDKRAITASIDGLPTRLEDPRIYFVAGTTPAQMKLAMEDFKKIQGLGRHVVQEEQYYQTGLQQDRRFYASALSNGLRVLPRYGDSFLYLMDLPTVPTTERPPTTRAVDKRREVDARGIVQLHSYTMDRVHGLDTSAGSRGYEAYDLAQITGKPLAPDALEPTAFLQFRKKAQDIADAQVLNPFGFTSSMVDMNESRLLYNSAAHHLPAYSKSKVTDQLAVVSSWVYDIGSPEIKAIAKKMMPALEAFTRAVMRRAGLRHPVIIMWGSDPKTSSPYHRSTKAARGWVHHIELYQSGAYEDALANGISVDAAILAIFKHELGHAITINSFFELPAALRTEVLASWQQARLFAAQNYVGASNIAGMLLPGDAARQVQLNSSLTFQAGPSYHLTLTEWWAEQARRWMDTDPGVAYAQDRLFKNFAKNFAEMERLANHQFSSAAYRLLQAEKPIHWWMEYMRKTGEGATLSDSDVKDMIRYRLGIEPRLNDMSYFPKLQGERLHKALADAVEAMLDRLPPGVKIKVDTTEAVDGTPTSALYYPTEKLLVISKAAFENPILLRTLKHEEVHILRDLFLPEEWKTLTDAAAAYFKDRPWRPGQRLGQLEATYRRDYTRNYKEMHPNATEEEVKAFVDQLIDEERVAHFLERRQQFGESFGERLNALLDRIIQFLREMMNALIRNDFPSLRQVIHDIESGMIAQRAAVHASARALDQNLKRERMGFVEQAPHFAPGLHIHASELQEMSRNAVDVWHGTPHEFATEVELTYPDGRKAFVPVETKLDEETIKGIKDGSIEVGAHPYGKFSLQKIDTGEGAQAYGWGLYFTETKGIAEHYRKTLSRRKHQLRADHEIKWDELPGGIKAKPLWEATFAWVRQNGPRFTDQTFADLLRYIQQGAFLSPGPHGIQSDYYGYEAGQRKVVEASDAYKKAYRDATPERLERKQKMAELEKQRSAQDYGSEAYNTLTAKLTTIAYELDALDRRVWSAALSDFNVTWEFSDQFEFVNGVIDAAAKTGNTSSLYRVKINATDEDFILYDKKLSEQSEKVKKTFGYSGPQPRHPFVRHEWYEWEDGSDTIWYRSYYVSAQDNSTLVPIHYAEIKSVARKGVKAKITGAKDYEVYFFPGKHTDPWRLVKTFADVATAKAYIEKNVFKDKNVMDNVSFYHGGSADAADRPGSKLAPRDTHDAEMLLKAGIKGIKYLDGVSRHAQAGNYNYVIFDESVLEIVERNGKPVDPQLKAAALEYFRSKIDHRAAVVGRARYHSDVRDEDNFKPDFVAKVAEGVYVAAETFNADDSRNLKDPDIVNLYFFTGPITGRVIGDVDTQVQQLGRQMGYLQLSKRDVGYETDYVNVRPEFRGQHLATTMQNWAGKRFNFTPRPSGILLADGYRMWQHRDPQAVKYYQKTSDGDYLSPTQIKASYRRIKAQIELQQRRGIEVGYYLQDRFDELDAMMKRLPAEAFEAAQLAKHYALDPALQTLNQVAVEQRYAEEKRAEQQVLAATPELREAAARIKNRVTGLDVLELPAKEGELETAPAFRLASTLGHIFNDPNASPEDKNVSRYLTGTLIPEVDRITKIGQRFIGLKQLVQRNPHLQGLADYDILVDQWNAERMKWIATGDTVMRSWRSLPRDEQGRLGELLFYMTEMEYRSNAEVAAGVVRQPTQAEVVRALQRFRITPEGVAVFDAVNTQFAEFLNSLEVTLTTELNKAYTPGTPAHAQAVQDLQNDFAGMRSRPYFPFMRHGRHTLTVRDAATKEVLWFSTYERVSERDNDVPQVVRRYPTGTIDVSIGLLPENVSQYQGMPPALLRHISDNMPGIAPAQKEWIEQLIYDKSPSQAFRRRLANRSGVAGYSREAQRAFAQYFMYGGAHLARLQYKRLLQDKVDQVRHDGRRLAAEVRRSMIADYMQDHLTYIMESGRDAFRFKSLVTLWYLAFSPAAAAANLTQVPMVTWPLLTSHFGQAKGNAALMKAYANHKVRKGKPSPKTVSAGYDKVRQQLIEEGYISIGLASELAGYSAGRTALTATVGTSGTRMLQDFTWAGMYMFQMAETFNREVTTAATFELVLKNPTANIVTSTQARYIVQITSLASKLNISIPEATAFFVIKNVIDQTQFNYSDFARAPFMRSKATQVLMPFVGYLQGALFAFGNNPGRAKMILALLMMGGLMALPGADDLDKAVKLVARRMFGKDFSLEKFTREMVGMITKGTRWDTVAPDVLLHGLGRVGGPQGLLPDSWGVPRFDWSGNVSLGRTQGLNELLQAAASGRKFSDLANQVSQQAGGPTYGMMYSMLQFLYGNPFSATAREWEAAMPRAAKAAVRAARWISQGAETTRSGARLPGTEFDLSQWTDWMELITQAAGFTPTRVRFAWENYALYTELDGWYKAQRSWLYEALDQAVRTDNSPMRAATLADIENFNAQAAQDGFGSYVITNQQLLNSIRNRATARARIENDVARSRGGTSTMQHIQDLRPNVYDTRRVR